MLQTSRSNGLHTVYLHWGCKAPLCISLSPVDTPNLSGVPQEYHDFADIFSKAKATTLTLHHKYDLHIDLEEGASPLLGIVYSLSQTELGVLQTFINEHLSYSFIWQSTLLMEPLFYSFTRRMVLSAFALITED